MCQFQDNKPILKYIYRKTHWEHQSSIISISPYYYSKDCSLVDNSLSNIYNLLPVEVHASWIGQEKS